MTFAILFNKAISHYVVINKTSKYSSFRISYFYDSLFLNIQRSIHHLWLLCSGQMKVLGNPWRVGKYLNSSLLCFAYAWCILLFSIILVLDLFKDSCDLCSAVLAAFLNFISCRRLCMTLFSVFGNNFWRKQRHCFMTKLIEILCFMLVYSSLHYSSYKNEDDENDDQLEILVKKH